MSTLPDLQDKSTEHSSGDPSVLAYDFASSGGFNSPRGPRKVSQTSLTSNESSESDDNIVLPRPVQLPVYQGKNQFSPFAPEFLPGAQLPSEFNLNNNVGDNVHIDHRRNSSSTTGSSRAPSTPGLIDFDSPESVNSSLETPDREAPQAQPLSSVIQQGEHQHSHGSQINSPFSQLGSFHTSPTSFRPEGQLELADEILKLQITPLHENLSRYSEPQQKSQTTPVTAGFRRITSPPPCSASKLHALARPWSPSPLRYEQRPGSTATASTVTPGPRETQWPLSPHSGTHQHPLGLSRLQEQPSETNNFQNHLQPLQSSADPARSRLSHVETGEPEDSFPYSAFTQWKQQHPPSDGATLRSPSNSANLLPYLSSVSPFMGQRRSNAHSRHPSEASSRGSSVDMYDLNAQPRSSHSQASTQAAKTSPHQPLSSPSPSALPLSFAQRQQQRQSAVLAASMASARRSSASSHGSSAAFDLASTEVYVSQQQQQQQPQTFKSRATSPVPLSMAQMQGYHARHHLQFDQAPMLPGAGLPGAGLPPAPSPSFNRGLSHSDTPSPGPTIDPMATLYHLNQLGFDAQTSDAILHLASTQPKVFVQMAGKTGNASTPGGPSPHNRKLGLYKTELCRSWEEKGSCRYGSKCQFAHGPAELRVINRHPKYKTQVCRTYWVTGSCPYGRRCCFLHNVVPSSTTPLSPAGPNDPPLVGQEPCIPSYNQQDPSNSSHTPLPYYVQVQQAQQVHQAQQRPQFYAEPQNIPQNGTGTSVSHSRSSSASSNVSGRAFEPTEADRPLLGRPPAGGLALDFSSITFPEQQSSSGLNTLDLVQHLPNKELVAMESAQWGRPSVVKHSTKRQYFGPLPHNPSRSSSPAFSSDNSEGSGRASESPYSPHSVDPFNSPLSATMSTVASPYTPLSAVNIASAWTSASSSAAERAYAAFHSAISPGEVIPSQPNLKVAQESSSSPNYPSFGAIGASRKSQQHSQQHRPLADINSYASDQEGISSSSALAQHARFLSHLAASGDNSSSRRDLGPAQGPQDAY